MRYEFQGHVIRDRRVVNEGQAHQAEESLDPPLLVINRRGQDLSHPASNGGTDCEHGASCASA
jgi:hypothetical protein